MTEVSGQVKNLEDEVRLLKGEIKSILGEIRTAVLSRDNPFTAGTGGFSDSQPAPAPQPEPAASEVLKPPAPTPGIPDLTLPMMPMNNPQPQPPGVPPVPPWAGAIPPQQPAPAPFAAPQMPAGPAIAPGPTVIVQAPGGSQAPPPQPPEAPPAKPPAVAESSMNESATSEPDEGDTAKKPIPIRPREGDEDEDVAPEPAPPMERSAWSLPALAGLAVWAEDALNTLGPRRFHFVLDLATFAELLSPEGREVLSGLIDADSLSKEDERPLNVNECLVVLRQLEAIVHGEKIVRLPRRRGVRHRRVR